ncbi:hypothetical protein P8452_47294 [Trifolium repens]|nr:hypothetical protein P8452_47294 [Trifolium repens]
MHPLHVGELLVLMLAEPTTAFGLIHKMVLCRMISLLCGVDGGEPLGLVQAEPAIVSGLIWDVALPNATAA